MMLAEWPFAIHSRLLHSTRHRYGPGKPIKTNKENTNEIQEQTDGLRVRQPKIVKRKSADISCECGEGTNEKHNNVALVRGDLFSFCSYAQMLMCGLNAGPKLIRTMIYD